MIHCCPAEFYLSFTGVAYRVQSCLQKMHLFSARQNDDLSMRQENQNLTFSQVCRPPAHLKSVLGRNVVHAEMLLLNSPYDQRCFNHTVDYLKTKQKWWITINERRINGRVIKEILFAEKKIFFYRTGTVAVIILEELINYLKTFARQKCTLDEELCASVEQMFSQMEVGDACRWVKFKLCCFIKIS